MSKLKTILTFSISLIIALGVPTTIEIGAF